MSGPTPISAGFRLVFNYNTNGKPHRLHIFADLVASADPTGYSAALFHGSGSVGLSTCLDYVWTMYSGWFNSGSTQFGSVVVQERIGTAWVDVTNYLTSVLPASGSPNILLTQAAITMKDTDNKHMTPTVFEGINPANIKVISYPVLNAEQQAAVNGWTNAGGTAGAGAPYFWARSRGNVGVNLWKAYLTKYNDKERKKAGLA